MEIAFLYVFRADGVLGAAIAGAGMVVVGGTVLALAGAAALVGILVKKKWGDATQDISHITFCCSITLEILSTNTLVHHTLYDDRLDQLGQGHYLKVDSLIPRKTFSILYFHVAGKTNTSVFFLLPDGTIGALLVGGATVAAVGVLAMLVTRK